MGFTLERARAAVACVHLAAYLRACKLPGEAAVLDTDNGYCLGVTLTRISPDVLEAVPPIVDTITVKVLI